MKEKEKKIYSDYTKEELIKELYLLKKTKKYGLVWEEKTEDVVENCKTQAPILKSVSKMNIIGKKEEQRHIMIEGDNYHALQILNYTHKGKVDVMYIDPPYNTGNDGWKYNDKIVDKEDAFRHSKWLSMMEKRLTLAKKLLSNNGVIFLSIDDNEHSNLKLLCDDVFGANRFVSTLIWQRASGGGNSGDIVTGHDFVLVYRNNKSLKFFGENSTRGKTIMHDGKEIVVDDDVVRKVFGKYKKGTERRCYYEELGKYKTKTKINEINRKIESGELVLIEIENGKHFIGKVIGPAVRKILYSIIQGVLNKDGKEELQSMFGSSENDIPFDNPKPSKFIQILINSLLNTKDGIFLDFFAGSGTTGHAVLQQNKEDGGNRQFILCTNNEGDIATDVCQPRLKKAMKGYKKNEDGEKVGGLGGNLEYLKTDFVDVENIDNISDKKKLKFTHEAGHVIALKENSFIEVEKNSWYQIFTDGKDKFVGIYFREDLKKISEMESKILDKKNVKLYIFSHSGTREWNSDYADYDNVVVEDIPEPILKVYKSLNL